MFLSKRIKKTLLQMGTDSNKVKEVQEMLFVLGFLPYQKNITGYFDATTCTSVKAFQIHSGIAVDGIVGPHTMRVLKTAYQIQKDILQSVKECTTIEEEKDSFTELIKHLEDLEGHCKSMIDVDEEDCIWLHDIAAIRAAIKAIKNLSDMEDFLRSERPSYQKELQKLIKEKVGESL